ncbi:major histocompatibility complex class I-related gene protein-like isoform X2 [Hemicordylus capensis]|uniref:major histocompatibility complex class I-related gene protein-like isoform X2 n=1 Tax=Hemicordylus capensis TaxID=884348 RepID=UPI0023040A16|nr:major histocompatibility complex class I-related gene protein-like isoform X2 [Hemicordylus capensis]
MHSVPLFHFISMAGACCRCFLLLGAAGPLVLGRCSDSSFHSLCSFFTLVSEPLQEVPQFVLVVYLDGQVLGHYDSRERRCVPAEPWVKKMVAHVPIFWELCAERAKAYETWFRKVLTTIQQLSNQSNGLHTWQNMNACEWSKYGHRRAHNWYAYDGRDFMSMDWETLTWMPANAEATVVNRWWKAEHPVRQDAMHSQDKECVDWLQRSVNYAKEALFRRESPVVKVACKVGSDNLETLTCRVYGFYPKEIDFTWSNDGEVQKQETLRGGVLPNSDGTYYTWLSIQIDPKDRRRYWCHVKHEALQEPLDVSCEGPVSGPFGLIVGVLAAILLLVAGIIYVKKRWQQGNREQSERREMMTTQLHEACHSPPQVSRLQSKDAAPTNDQTTL